MLEEKKAQGSRQQGSADAGHPKTSKINSSTRKTDHVSNSSNVINRPRRSSSCEKSFWVKQRVQPQNRVIKCDDCGQDVIVRSCKPVT
ncbi:hypothetical protein ABVT39_008921 [Epinephelus coioides]